MTIIKCQQGMVVKFAIFQFNRNYAMAQGEAWRQENKFGFLYLGAKASMTGNHLR